MILRSIIIALRNLVHDPARTSIALAGSGFSLIVIFMQLGLFRATERTATLVLDKLDFDLVITSRHYQYFADAGTFPISRVRTAGSVPGVETVVPLYIRTGLWRSLGEPSGPGSGGEPAKTWRRRSILVLSYFTSDRPFLPDIPGLEEQGEGSRIGALEEPDALFIDRRSREEFGPQDVGSAVELNNRKFRLSGAFEMGTGFAAEGAALLSHQNFARAFGGDELDRPSLGLIKLASSADVEEVEARLREALPGPSGSPGFQSPSAPTGPSRRADADVRVARRREIEGAERRYWVRERTIGVLFAMGVVISFLVGLVVFYQVLSSDIADHLSEYATLKAMGYADGDVAAIVIAQASLLGLIGYGGALVVAIGLFAWVEWSNGIPMKVLDPTVLGIPLILGQLMSTGSALVSIRKLSSADPADLFR